MRLTVYRADDIVAHSEKRRLNFLFAREQAVSVVPTIGCSEPGSAAGWTSSYDWICVGSGIEGGVEAAIFGHDRGFKTLLLEESALVCGDSPHGLLYAPMNYLMKEAGISDSREEALSYFQYIGSGYTSPEFIEAFVDNAARCVEYLHQKADVPFQISELIDFWTPSSEGGWRLNESTTVGSKKLGRSLACKPFPSNALGTWRNKVRLNSRYLGFQELLDGQEHNPGLGRLTEGASWGSSVGHSGPFRGKETVALSLWRERLGPAKLEEVLKKDEEIRVAGPALAGYLFRAVMQRGIDVQTETATEQLVVENGRVAGVVVNHRGKEARIKANRGVVLTAGAGNGWRLAAHAGGAVSSKLHVSGTPSIRVPEPSRRGNYECRMRHSMIVNRFGERFGDEGPYLAIGAKLLDFDSHDQHRFRNIPNFFIFDHQLIEKYSFVGRPPGATEGLDWVAQGRTLAELAQMLKIPAQKLGTTIARFNEHARKGKDLDFHRRPETLGPIEKPPFYGVVANGPYHNPLEATISVVTDTNGQVLHYLSRAPIPGLYACSHLQEDKGLMGVTGYMAGVHLMMGVVFAMLAAEHAASVR
jgi:3-oxosteroid 1-dehydrogenase